MPYLLLPALAPVATPQDWVSAPSCPTPAHTFLPRLALIQASDIVCATVCYPGYLLQHSAGTFPCFACLHFIAFPDIFPTLKLAFLSCCSILPLYTAHTPPPPPTFTLIPSVPSAFTVFCALPLNPLFVPCYSAHLPLPCTHSRTTGPFTSLKFPAPTTYRHQPARMAFPTCQVNLRGVY